MSALFRGRGRVAAATLILAMLVSLGTQRALPVRAEGGFALSGSFYAQELEMPPGARLDSPEVYVVVFNNSDADFKVRMTTEAPLGVTLGLSENEFALGAGEQRRVTVSIEVTADAAPGEHEISVTAEPYRDGAQGIQIIGAAGQTATLMVVGESAGATVQVVSPDGAPVTAVVRLSKVLDGKQYEVAQSETGQVQARLAPGRYVAAAYVGGEQLAEESFDLAAGEERTVSLAVRTIYFEGFGIVPSYRSGSEEIGSAQVVYTVKNLYKPVETADVFLVVRRDGEPLEEIALATLSPLELGRLGLNYNYIPAAGWTAGSYALRLELRLGGAAYATTPEQELAVGGQPAQTQQAQAAAPAAPAAPPPVTTAGASSPPGVPGWIWALLGIVVASIGAAGLSLIVRSRTGAQRYW